MVSSVTTSLSNLGNTVFGGGGQKFASIAQGTSSASLEVVAAVAGMKIRILAAVFVMTDAVGLPSVQLFSATTALTGDMQSSKDVQLVLPFNPAGWVETVAGEAFKITSTTSGANGFVVYDVVASD